MKYPKQLTVQITAEHTSRGYSGKYTCPLSVCVKQLYPDSARVRVDDDDPPTVEIHNTHGEATVTYTHNPALWNESIHRKLGNGIIPLPYSLTLYLETPKTD